MTRYEIKTVPTYCARTGTRIERRHVFKPGGVYAAEHITLSGPAPKEDPLQPESWDPGHSARYARRIAQ
jgi:hypothetical protein